VILDNQAAQAMGHSFRDTEHTRHIARRWHYVRYMVAQWQVTLLWIDTSLMPSDAATKNLEPLAKTYLLCCAVTQVPVPID